MAKKVGSFALCRPATKGRPSTYGPPEDQIFVIREPSQHAVVERLPLPLSLPHPRKPIESWLPKTRMPRHKVNGCVRCLPPFLTLAPSQAVGPEATTVRARSSARRQHMYRILPCSQRVCCPKLSSLSSSSSPLVYSSNTFVLFIHLRAFGHK